MESVTDPCLDFCSLEFDPVKVLSADLSQLHLPCPEVLPCTSLKQYEVLVKGKMKPKFSDQKPRDEGKGSDRVSGVKVEQQPRFKIKSVLDFMKEPINGPIRLLQDCHAHKRELQVWIRHSSGLRGVCVGRLVAFDRHMNIVLSNVTEYYTPLQTVSNGGMKKRRKRKSRRAKTATEDGVKQESKSQTHEQESQPKDQMFQIPIQVDSFEKSDTLEQRPQIQAQVGQNQEQGPKIQAQGGQNQEQGPQIQVQGGQNQEQGPKIQAQRGQNQEQGPQIQAQGGQNQEQGPQIQAQGGQNQEQSHTQRKWKMSRHVNQIFIRGDNVILVTPIKT